MIKHAAKRGWCSQIVMERPEKPPGRVRWISPEQADQLIEACNEQLRPLVIFLLYTGARIGEALWLNWSDVDLTRGHVIFPIDPSDGRRTKNNEARGVPLHPRVRAALANLPHRDGEVFRRPDGLPYARLRAGRHVSERWNQEGVRGRVQACGYQELLGALLPAHVGDLALRQEPRPSRAAKAWRLENTRHGDALRARQCWRAGTHHRQSAVERSWGKTRGHGINQRKDSMTIKSIMQEGNALHTGEVVVQSLQRPPRQAQ